jgi:hypothetical protein
MINEIDLDGMSGDTSAVEMTPLLYAPIAKHVARQTVIDEHYLHRPCAINWAFGASLDGRLVGVLTVGKPPSWSLQYGLVGEKYAQRRNDPTSRSKDVFELNRLWMSDSILLPHCESKFIGWCLRELRKIRRGIILVSYADSARNHIGVVYKATNWIYTGTSQPFIDLHPEGYGDYRSVPMSVRGNKINGRKREWANDPKVRRVQRSIKHRYVWFANPADQSLLAWQVLPYPRHEEPEPEK